MVFKHYTKDNFWIYEYKKDYKIPKAITIAMEQTLTGYEIGVAICNHNDQFNKKKGRELAKTRLLTKPVVLTESYLRSLIYQFVHNLTATVLLNLPVHALQREFIFNDIAIRILKQKVYDPFFATRII